MSFNSSDQGILTIRTEKAHVKKRVYPIKFRILVLTLESLYASIAVVTRANGW